MVGGQASASNPDSCPSAHAYHAQTHEQRQHAAHAQHVPASASRFVPARFLSPLIRVLAKSLRSSEQQANGCVQAQWMGGDERYRLMEIPYHS